MVEMDKVKKGVEQMEPSRLTLQFLTSYKRVLDASSSITFLSMRRRNGAYLSLRSEYEENSQLYLKSHVFAYSPRDVFST
jgi:hypothetical protein